VPTLDVAERDDPVTARCPSRGAAGVHRIEDVLGLDLVPPSVVQADGHGDHAARVGRVF
jgi:hypothetical protein